MSLEKQVADLVTSTNALTQAVASKLGQINAALDAAVEKLGAELSSQPVTLRNRVINGDMRVDQRNDGAALTDLSNSSSDFPVDRFRTNGRALPTGRFTLQRIQDAPVGFLYSLKASVTTAEAVGIGQVFTLEHAVEVQSMADFNWGTRTPQPAVLSFWVKTSIAGRFTVAVRSVGYTPERTFLAAYTVEKAHTWEQKCLAIPSPGISNWSRSPTAACAVICWNLGSGTNFRSPDGGWATESRYRISGDINLIETLGATFQITGVQLEKGDSPTPFEFRPFGLELLLCQRYYYQTESFRGGSPFMGGAHAIAVSPTWCYTLTPTPPTSLRAQPTVVIKSAGSNRERNRILDMATENPVEIAMTYAGQHFPPQMSGTAFVAGRLYGFDYSLSADL